MPEWGWSLAGAAFAPLVLFFWQGLLKRETTEDWGRRIGRFITLFLRQRLGVAGGNSVREKFQSTVEDFTNGLRQGMKIES